MNNIEMLLSQGSKYEIRLHGRNNDGFQAYVYLTADWDAGTYPEDFCDGSGTNCQEALQALDVNLGKMFMQHGLPSRWDWEEASTPTVQESVQQQDSWSPAEAASVDIAQIRYSIEIMNGKSHEDAMRRSFITAMSQLVAHLSHNPSDEEFKVLLVKVRDAIQASKDDSLNYSGLQYLFPQI